ncbi:MAG: hypothetical protein KDE27_04950 [Planctomycetes bacterium]|nr:hypothetical protein [Planctomycetota bacterium]
MRTPRIVLAAALAASAAALPAQTATDVGLRLGGGVLTVIYGQDCGPFSCTPVQAGPAAAGQPYNAYVYGAVQQPFALAIDLDTNAPCIAIPGIANSLLLVNQPVTLAFGLTQGPSLSASCIVGRGSYVLQFPNGTPAGVTFLLQAVAVSRALNQPAFTIAIRSVTA